MEIILSASLAGGVVMGACATYTTYTFGAMIAGFTMGMFSAFGFGYLKDWLKKLRIHDTCGTFHLHLIPGFAGGVMSCIVASRADEKFGGNYYSLFPNDLTRTAGEQGGY